MQDVSKSSLYIREVRFRSRLHEKAGGRISLNLPFLAQFVVLKLEPENQIIRNHQFAEEMQELECSMAKIANVSFQLVWID